MRQKQVMASMAARGQDHLSEESSFSGSAFLAVLALVFSAVMPIARGSASLLGKFARFSVFFLKLFMTVAFGMLLGLHRGLGFGLAIGAGLVQLPGGDAFVMQPVPFDDCFCVGSIRSNTCCRQFIDYFFTAAPNPLHWQYAWGWRAVAGQG